MQTPKKRPNRAEQRAARQRANDLGTSYQKALQQIRAERAHENATSVDAQ
jgi:hypothetical protein